MTWVINRVPIRRSKFVRTPRRDRETLSIRLSIRLYWRVNLQISNCESELQKRIESCSIVWSLCIQFGALLSCLRAKTRREFVCPAPIRNSFPLCSQPFLFAAFFSSKSSNEPLEASLCDLLLNRKNFLQVSLYAKTQAHLHSNQLDLIDLIDSPFESNLN